MPFRNAAPPLSPAELPSNELRLASTFEDVCTAYIAPPPRSDAELPVNTLLLMVNCLLFQIAPPFAPWAAVPIPPFAEFELKAEWFIVRSPIDKMAPPSSSLSAIVVWV